MTPLDTGSLSLARVPAARTFVRIGLDRRLEPAHLPLLALDAWDIGAARGLRVAIQEGLGVADAVDRLAAGGLDAFIAGPLALLHPAAAGCVAAACLARSVGGVLITTDRLDALCLGDTVRIAALRDEPQADGLCRLLLQRWAALQGRAVAGQTIAVDTIAVEALPGADPFAALAEGYDGVWPARSSLEAVVAAARELPMRLVSLEECGLPGVTLLDVIVRTPTSAEPDRRIVLLLPALEEAIRRLRADPAAALRLWQERSAVSDDADQAVIAATLASFILPLEAVPERRRVLGAVL
jgi:hypothetical protein